MPINACVSQMCLFASHPHCFTNPQAGPRYVESTQSCMPPSVCFDGQAPRIASEYGSGALCGGQIWPKQQLGGGIEMSSLRAASQYRSQVH